MGLARILLKFRFKSFKFFVKLIAYFIFLFIICFAIVSLTNLQKFLKNLNSAKSFKIGHRKKLDYESVVDSKLIFIGGYARSGTTLMRAILDVHPSVSCGPETKVIPTILEFVTKYKAKANLMKDLYNAKIENNTIDSALSLFIYHILKNHVRIAERLCAKDPNILLYMEYLHYLFPKAKFVYMVRDGRAACYSYMLRAKEVLNHAKYRIYLRTWHNYNHNVYRQCNNIGKQFCKIIKYEELVLHPEKVLRELVTFLELDWTKQLLNHQNFIGDRIVVSQTEWSTDQIIKPINSKSLYNWIDKVAKFQIDPKFLGKIAPMLTTFGYNLIINKNQYENLKPDELVVENDKNIEMNKQYWIEKAKNFSSILLSDLLWENELKSPRTEKSTTTNNAKIISVADLKKNIENDLDNGKILNVNQNDTNKLNINQTKVQE